MHTCPETLTVQHNGIARAGPHTAPANIDMYMDPGNENA